MKHRTTPVLLAYAYRKRSSAIAARNRPAYNQPEVTDAVNALLALDPLDITRQKSPLFRPFISHRSGRAVIKSKRPITA